MPRRSTSIDGRLRALPLVLCCAFAAGGRAAPSGPPEAPAVASAAAAVGAEPGTTAVAPPPGDGIPVVGWDAPPVHTPSAPHAWGGPRTGKEATLSLRVADYDLRAVLDPVKHTIEGTEKLRWRNRSDRPVRTLYFHTFLNGFQGEDSTWMTEKRKYGSFRTDVKIKKGEWGWIDVLSVAQGGRNAELRYVQPDGGPATDRSVLRVDLPEAVPPGGEAALELRFHDQLPRVVARTGYFDTFHLVAQWFPKIGVLELAGERGAEGPRWNVHEFHLNTEFYADWGSYELEVIVPKGYTVGAVGARVGEPVETAEGVAWRFHQDDVHDSAFTAWNGFAPPLTGSYDGPGSPHVAVQVLYPPEWADSGRIALQGTLDSLKYFSETLGPYPYSTVTVVMPPHNAGEAGGMEYETFFTTVGGNGPINGVVRYVTVHEFGHGYFMGLLASNEFEEPHLDEGMNEWWDSRMQEAEELRIPLGLADTLGFSIPKLRIFDYEHLGGAAPRIPDPLAGNSWHRYSGGSYSSIYPRTTVVMHDLEKLLGGDAIARGMKLYYARWHHRHPSTADLREALCDAAPEHRVAIEQWFEEMVYGGTPVDDQVDTVEANEVLPLPGTELREGKRVEVEPEALEKQIAETRKAWKKEHPSAEKGDHAEEKAAGPFPWQSVVRARRGGAQVPQKLLVEFEGGGQETIAWPVGERWHRWVFVGPQKIAQARLDPAGDILLDINKLDDGRTREAHKLPAARWTLEAGAWLGLFFSLLGAL